MLQIELSITAEDIARGIRDRAYGCPVSLALSRFMNGLFGTHAQVGVTRNMSVVTYNDTPVMARWAHHTNVKEFLNRFDKGEPVEPCNVHVELMDVRCNTDSHAAKTEEPSIQEEETERCTESSQSKVGA